MQVLTKRNLAILLIIIMIGIFIWIFNVIRPVNVEVAQIHHSRPVQVFGLGTVEAKTLSKLGFEVSGTLLNLAVDHGDRVAKGSVLARLASEEQEARLAKAEASLAVAKVQVERARAVLAQRQATYARQQALLRQGNISKEVANEGKTNAEIARAEVKVAEVAVHQAQAQLQLERALLHQHILHSPYGAIVVTRHMELGTVLNPGEPVLTLVDPDSIWALAYVDESLAGGIKQGQPAMIRFRSLPHQSYPGYVARVGIESDRVSEERRVYVKCNQCPAEFYLGEQVEILITVATLNRALLVPQTAITQYDGSQGYAWLVVAGELQRRQLEFGYRTIDGYLQVITDLPEDVSVVAGQYPGLREGRWASIVPANRP